MTLTLLLPWFPILLAVGVGGRLLGRTRGFALGFLSAMFWVVLVQASAGTGIWRDPWTLVTVLVGAVAIFAMGGWSGQHDAESVGRSEGVAAAEVQQLGVSAGGHAVVGLEQIASVIERFDDWLTEHRYDRDPWPDFAEFIRGVLYRCCNATHVKTFRLLNDGTELQTLRQPDPFDEPERISTGEGVIGQVATSGRSWVAVASAPAAQREPGISWCFPISRGARRVGVVAVGKLGVDPVASASLLKAVSHLVGQFWNTLSEVGQSRSAAQEDPISGLYTRQAFLHVAQQSLRESYHLDEPVAVAVVTVQGLRELNDAGRWEVADELIRAVGDLLRRKMRLDDRIGRFDGSRFIWLLRRVDSSLAQMIARQVVSRIKLICADPDRWHASISVRCGLTGTGTEKPDLRTLVSRALVQSHRARVDGVEFLTDLPPDPSVGAPVDASAAEVVP